MPETTIPYSSVLADQREKVKEFIMCQIRRSRTDEKEPRRPQNEKNWRFFHGNIDWSHKREGDARIHLHKLGIAAERHRAKFKANLMKFDNWVSVDLEPGAEPRVLTDSAAKRFTIQAIERAKGKTKLSDAILLGEMEGRSTLRVGWERHVVPKFVAKGNQLRKLNNKKGQLDIQTRNFEEFHRDSADPKHPLYEAEELLVDFYRVKALAASKPTPDKPFRLEAVEALGPFMHREQEVAREAREGNFQRDHNAKDRKMVSLINYFGSVLDENGDIFKWKREDGQEIPLEGVLVTLGNEQEVLLDPITIPNWDGMSDFVCAEPLRSPGSGIKAIMDAGTDLNEAENELFSMMLTGAYKSVHNVTWYREDYIADGKKLSGGIKDGDSIPIDASAPANAAPIGVVRTGEMPQDAVIMKDILSRAFAENVFSNLLDLSGNMGSKQVRATEVVQANEAIGDVAESLAADLEEDLIEPFLQKCFLKVMQNSNDLSDDEIMYAFNGDKSKVEEFKAMTPQERFADAAGNFRFTAKGLRSQISNAAKGQAIINFLNTLTANPITFEAIQSQISVPRLSKLVAKGLGLDEEEFSTTPEERKMIEQRQLIQEQALAEAANQGNQPGQKQPANPKQGSQPRPEQPGPGGGL